MDKNERIIELEKRVAELHEANELLQRKIHQQQLCVCSICDIDHTGVKGLVGSMAYLCFRCKKYILDKVDGLGRIEVVLKNGEKLLGKIVPIDKLEGSMKKT